MEEYTGEMILIPHNNSYTVGTVLIGFAETMSADEIANTVEQIIVRDYTSKTEWVDNLYCVGTDGKLAKKTAAQ